MRLSLRAQHVRQNVHVQPRASARPLAKLSSDEFAETLFHVGMAWNGGFLAGPGIHINVVLLTMPLQITAGFDKLADKLTSPHTSNPISLV